MRRLLAFAVLGFAVAVPVVAQKAGVITRFNNPARIVEPAARPGLGEKSVPAANNLAVKWHDALETAEGGRMRAQLNDGSILSIGSKTRLVVEKHDERHQQSQIDLQYGKVRSQVIHLGAPDSRFEVRTATAVCGVLGTDDVVDGENPASTIVIVITGVVAVRSNNPNVVGTVTLTAGQFTTVNAGQAPTGAQAASAAMIDGEVMGTTGTTGPEPTVSLTTLQVPYGTPFTLDGAASTGGLGNIIGYQWTVTGAGGFSYSTPMTANSVFTLDTTQVGWTPGAYTGMLTVTTDTGKSAKAPFTFTILQPPSPADVIASLAQAYTNLLPNNIDVLFDPGYPGASALEQQLEAAKTDILSLLVTYPEPQISISGLRATCSTNFIFRIAPRPVPPATSAPLVQLNTGNVVFTMTYHTDTNRWLISDVVGNLGGPGMLSVPGSGNPKLGNNPVTNPDYIPQNSVTLSTGGIVTAFAGSTTRAVGISVNGPSGSSGLFTIHFTLPSGVTVAGPSTLTLTNGLAEASYLFSINGSVPAGSVPIPYTITNGTTSASGLLTLNVQRLTVAVSGAGTQATPLQVFSGNSASTTVAVSSTGGSINEPVTLTAASTVEGLSVNVGTLFGGSAPITVTSLNSNTGPALIIVNANTPSGGTAVATIFVTLTAPVTVALPLQTLTTAPNATGGVNIPVTFASGFSGTVTITAPTITGMSFSPTSVTLNQSGTPNFSATTNLPPQTLNTAFTLKAGAFTLSLPETINIRPAFDFTISGGSLTLAQGGSGTVDITVTGNGGLPPSSGGIGPGGITVTATNVPQGLTVTGGGGVGQGGTTTFQVAATSTVPAGTLTFTVQGTFGVGVLVHTATVTVNVTQTQPVGTWTLNGPSSINIFDGQSGSVVLNVVPQGGFAGTVAISSAGTGATVSGPSTITPGTPATFVITPTATSSAVVFTASSPGITQMLTVNFSVQVGFTLTVPPVNGFQSGSFAVAVDVTRAVGFTGTVVITPLSAPSGITLNPATFTLAPTEHEAVFTATATSNASGGSAVFSATAAGGKQAAQASGTISLNGPFVLQPVAITAFAGATVPIAIPVQRSSGFNGTVVLTPLGGLPGVVLTPSSVTVPPGQNSATFTASIGGNGSSGSIFFSASTPGNSYSTSTHADLTIVQPFSIGGFSGISPVTPGMSQSATFTVTFANGFTGPVTLSATPSTNDLNTSLSTVTLTSSGTVTLTVTAAQTAQSGSASVTITGVAGQVSMSAAVPVTITGQPVRFMAAADPMSLTAYRGNNAYFDVNVTPVNGFAGSVMICTPSSLPAGVDALYFNDGRVQPQSRARSVQAVRRPSEQGACQSVRAGGYLPFYLIASGTAPSSAALNLTATDGVTTQTVPLNVSFSNPFSISVSAPNSVPAQSSGTVVVTVNFVDVNNTATVTPTVSPAGAATFSPPYAQVFPSSNQASFTAMLSASAMGTVTFGATASTQNSDPFTISQNAATTTISSPMNFTAQASPSSITVGEELDYPFTIQVTPVNEFSGTVTVCPPASLPPGITGVSQNDRVRAQGRKHVADVGSCTQIVGGGFAYYILYTTGNMQTSPTLNMTATDGIVTQTIPITVNIVNTYTVNVSAPSSLNANSSSTISVTLTNWAQGGGGGNAIVTPTVLPAGSATFTPSSLAVPVYSTNPVTFSVTLTASASGNVTFGANTSFGSDNTPFMAAGMAAPTTVVVPTFTITGNANGNQIFNGVPRNAVATVTFQNGYSGSVTVTASSTNPNLIITQNGGNIVTSNGGTVSFTVQGNGSTAQQGPQGFVDLTFTGTDTKSMMAQSTATPAIGDPYGVCLNSIFTCNPQNNSGSPIAVNRDSSTTIKIIFAPTTNFTGQVTILAPSTHPGLLSVSPPSQTCSGSCNATFTLTGGSSVQSSMPMVFNVDYPNATGPTFTAPMTVYYNVQQAQPQDRFATPARRDRITMSIRNDACAGLRIITASQSSCGGSVDLEIQASITVSGAIEARAMSYDGGLRDLGAMSLGSPILPADNSSAAYGGSSQMMLVAGHTYLVTTRRGPALVRVARIQSSLNPRLVAAILSPGAGKNPKSPTGNVFNVHEADSTDQVLNNARITVDLEFVASPNSP